MSCARHERSGLTERRGGRGGPNQQSVCLSGPRLVHAVASKGECRVSTVCGLNSTSCARRALADRGASTAARVRPVTRTRAPQAARRGGR